MSSGDQRQTSKSIKELPITGRDCLDVIIDFSASSVPKLGSDSIWISYAIRSNQFPPHHQLFDTSGHSDHIDRANFNLDFISKVKFYELKSGERATDAPPPSPQIVSINVSTRIQLERLLYRLIDLLPKGTSMRIGFDFALGFPSLIGMQLAQNMGISTPISSKERAIGSDLIIKIGSLIKDQIDNTNNRLIVASEINSILGLSYFWGIGGNAKTRGAAPLLAHRKPPIDFDLEYRLVERVINTTKRLRPSSIRQLFGVGAVGSQSLLGMGLISRIVAKVGRDQIAIWPFDEESRLITLFEIWPTLAATKRELRNLIRTVVPPGAENKITVDALETLEVYHQMGKMELPAVDQLSNALLLLMGDKFGTLSASGELNTDAREVRRIESAGGSALSLIRGQPHSSAIASELIRNEGWIGNLNLNIT
ncbi:MAG: hypothetical protein M0T78_05135 [Actinomycetota bacterium]|nr:hypothetical protein [Actinomycetota bacterium]